MSMLTSGYVRLVVLLLSASAAEIALAQALGTITGTVTDASGASIPRAMVTATETGTGFQRSILSDETGHYTVPNLRPTEYDLTVEAAGFRRYAQRTIKLEADQTATLQ